MWFLKTALGWVLEWVTGRLVALFQAWQRQKVADKKVDDETKEDIKRTDDVLKDEKATDDDFDKTMRDSIS